MRHSISVSGRELEVAVVDSKEEFGALRGVWKDVLSASVTDSGFTTWEWLYTWSERFIAGERRLFVLVVFDGSEVIGIAPWYIQRVARSGVPVREIGFLGLPEAGSDYLDVIAKAAKEPLVAQALHSVLFGTLASHWDTIGLKEIPAESAFLAHFISELRRHGKYYETDEGSFCPGVRLPDSFEAYLHQLSSHSRHAYRRKMRALLSNEGVRHVVRRGAHEVQCALPALKQLYQMRWAGDGDDLFALLAGYLPRAEEAWQVEVSLLTVRERPVAGLLHLTNGKKMYQYLMAVDRSFNRRISIGSLICGINIQAAIEAGCVEYDFLRGMEDHKLKFMNRARRSMNVSVHNKTLRSLSAWTIGAARHFGKLLLR